MNCHCALGAAGLLGLLMTMTPLEAQDTRYPPDGEILPGPAKPADFADWLGQLKQWRHEKLIRMGYNGSEYARPELLWSQRNFIQPQVMVEDRFLYDPVTRRYTVDRFLDDVTQRYGGIDSILLWPVYPNIGIDIRNQFDLHYDLPGGPAGLRQMVADFHKRGVKVFWPTMPWDTGTREAGMAYWAAAARIAAETGSDGINGDTFHGLPLSYKTAADQAGRPVVLEPETALEADEQLAWNTMSWGYWKYPWVPGVSRYKWLEPRHMVNICARWAKDRNDQLQAAFFNGVGYESWENVWGIWNGITPRDGEALRRVATIERQFASLLVSPEWAPHTPTLQHGIFATKFPGAAGTLYTLVNRNAYDVAGRQLEAPATAGLRFFDVYHGRELQAERDGGRLVLNFEMEALGYGAIYVTAQPDAELPAFLTRMREMSARELRSYAQEWKALGQTRVEIPAARAATASPEGYVKIPAGRFEFQVSGIMIEGGNDVGVDVQYPGEPSARRHHRRMLEMPGFYLMKHPVTNAQFKKFMDATQYHPADDHNFLRDWKNGNYPEGWAQKPVTWVSLEDARAYAAWAGARLPHEWEWQYAAQGTDGRLYPWGAEFDASAVPPKETGRTVRAPSDVGAYPKGASPFGVEEMVGHVWQWTDEYTDEHTRAAVLRGGSYYWPQGSAWYFPNTYKLNEHGKYLLMAPAKDRSGLIGFRCALDL
ncbi:formylglycine-generating enzyme family protein [Paludibaculum fermentans]|uniref:SUMF1/EgtB/PvdO family nonheme iron enzyme n=1 Tax=Paludibaculum fermentans TaxID=1473598 RepID=A0A7S7NQZ3_PALFE|nr:SUMF1/EgtB/PvdO family nonheme iron enzyme [Paludibaculum fermentans]QOY88110.1 SUMF1/EgtB/PvdO family nonheme iron enzyme [Paludibaculum fermentans]